jgi:hypothetical protein
VTKSTRRFPPPWKVEQIPGGYVVKDSTYRIFRIERLAIGLGEWLKNLSRRD